jgi:hypothetical protein
VVVLTVFFDVAALSYLPTVVGRERLLDAGAAVAGPSIAGVLIQVTAAPVAVAVDAATFLWSAVCLRAIRRPEPPPRASGPRDLWREMGAGVGFVARHPLLRPIALAGAATNLFLQIGNVTLPPVFLRELGLLGLFFAFGGGGVFLGVLLVSLRQRVTPDDPLSRMNATMRFLFTGVLAVGAAVAGAIGETAGVRTALWVSAIGVALSWVPTVLSPLRHEGARPAFTGKEPATRGGRSRATARRPRPRA